MPDTVFFKDGKVDFFTTTDREGYLNFEYKTKLDSLLNVRTKIAEIVKDRKKDTE